MASIAENIRAIREQIAAAAQRCGRSGASVRLLAVTKTQSPDAIAQAYAAGQREFGENYVQEALSKISALALPGILWHFIGPLQSNKTRDIATHFDWVHSVERLKIAQRLNEQRPAGMPPLNICIQVNVSGEDSKSGVALEQVEALCDAIAPLHNLVLRGLMAIPAPSDDADEQRRVLHPLGPLLQKLALRYPQMDTLSMGMSGDFAAAIAEGSTIIRVGSAIFGPRPTSAPTPPG